MFENCKTYKELYEAFDRFLLIETGLNIAEIEKDDKEERENEECIEHRKEINIEYQQFSLFSNSLDHSYQIVKQAYHEALTLAMNLHDDSLPKVPEPLYDLANNVMFLMLYLRTTKSKPKIKYTKPQSLQKWADMFGGSRERVRQRFIKGEIRNKKDGKMYAVDMEELPKTIIKKIANEI